jgi:replication factor C subunit 1
LDQENKEDVKRRVQQVIQLMDQYDLTKEDWDSVLEITQFDDDISKLIPSNVKATLTRTYNAHHHAVRVARGSKRATAEGEDEEEAAAAEGFPDVEHVAEQEEKKEEKEENDLASDKMIKIGKVTTKEKSTGKSQTKKQAKKPTKPRKKS